MRNTVGERLDELEGVLDMFPPIPDGAVHVTTVDVVKWARVQPRLFDIIDFEPDVGRRAVE